MKKILLVAVGSCLLLTANLALNTGCGSTATSKSAGEVIDDAAITTKVKSAFATDDHVKAMNISVTTYKGTVQLSGFADSAAEKSRAEQVARGVTGVHDVVNNITVK